MTYRSYLHISIAFDCHEGQRKATRRLGVPGLLRLPCGSCGCRWPGWDGLGRVGTGWDAGIPRENHGKTMEKPRKSPFGHMIYDLMVFHDFSISKCLQEGIFWEYWMILGWCHELVENGWVKFHVDRIGLERGGKRRWLQWETIEHGGCSASPFQD